MRSLIVGLAVGSFIIGSEPARGQRAYELRRGAKVRVTMSGGTTTLGSLERITEDTLAIRPLERDSKAGTAQIQRDLITSMEVRTRTPGKGILYGGLIGLLIGGGTGFIVGAATYDDECFIVCSAAEAGMFVGALGAMVSVPIGMVVGGVTRREWRQVDITRR